MTGPRRPRLRKGAALLIVLWTAMLLSMLLAQALSAARIEARIAAARAERLKAAEAMRSALTLASYDIATGDADLLSRATILQGVSLNGYDVRVARAEDGRFDINMATEAEWVSFLEAQGLKNEEATKLAARIADWRDADDLARPNGAERRDYRDAKSAIANRDFRSADEVRAVLGWPRALSDCLGEKFSVIGSGARPGEGPSASAQLGTAARGAAPGMRYALTAFATKRGTAERKITATMRTGDATEVNSAIALQSKTAARALSCAQANAE